jgi:hypothetical protein
VNEFACCGCADFYKAHGYFGWCTSCATKLIKMPPMPQMNIKVSNKKPIFVCHECGMDLVDEAPGWCRSCERKHEKQWKCPYPNCTGTRLNAIDDGNIIRWECVSEFDNIHVFTKPEIHAIVAAAAVWSPTAQGTGHDGYLPINPCKVPGCNICARAEKDKASADMWGGKDVKCECGSTALGSPQHSHYCPKFVPNKP